MDSSDERPNPVVQARQQVLAVINFFKFSSFSELVDKIVIIIGLLIFLGFVVMVGAMMGWITLITLIATSIVMWIITLFWLWMFN